ncbi:MAG: aldo/keto reductase [Bacteroidota bacterium]
MDIQSTRKMNDGLEIPVLGFGTYKIRQGDDTFEAALHALKTGYRHIDTAAMYGNEAGVGRAVRESGIPREEIFITTKVWNSDQGYEPTLRAFDESLAKLKMDYVDLYLIHWPVSGKRTDTWKALQNLYSTGRAKSVGVSNFTIRHLDELADNFESTPAVNQVEFHPWLYQRDLLNYCKKNGILLEAYSPLVRAKKFGEPGLKQIAEKYGKTEAQILIRWSIQHGAVPLPKSTHKSRIEENADIFDFEIDMEDMIKLDDFDEGYRITWDPSDVD